METIGRTRNDEVDKITIMMVNVCQQIRWQELEKKLGNENKERQMCPDELDEITKERKVIEKCLIITYTADA